MDVKEEIKNIFLKLSAASNKEEKIFELGRLAMLRHLCSIPMEYLLKVDQTLKCTSEKAYRINEFEFVIMPENFNQESWYTEVWTIEDLLNILGDLEIKPTRRNIAFAQKADEEIMDDKSYRIEQMTKAIENAFYLKKKGTELLKDLKKVPACEDKIQTEWHGFRKGTDIHDIYRCIESVYKAGVALDV